MTPRLVLRVLLALSVLPAHAAELSSYKTADSLWAHVMELRKEPAAKPTSREEMLTMVKEWFTKQRMAAEAFIVAYPGDQRRWEAKMIVLQTSLQLSQLPDADPAKKTNADIVLREIEAIAAAPDAPVETKGEAAFIQTMMGMERVDPDRPDTIRAMLEAGDTYLAKYPTHKFAPQMRQAQLRLAAEYRTPDTEAFLKELTEDKDDAVASAARAALDRAHRLANLRTKPLDLKFTATDGQEIDLVSLRGRVVLLDFWASWCGPCLAEMPNVVAIHDRLHERGFRVLGISLDQDRAQMESALKKFKMTWPQHFDGKGWRNEVTTSFGIQSIPATWLLDKKGMLRETDLRGPALAEAIEKLLAE
jgi:thiol-disulfide isomerase/thioredoxin